MFNKEKTYTMEEFEEMFDKAVKVCTKQLDADMGEAIGKSGKDVDPMLRLVTSMQNMMAYAELKQTLFPKDTK